MDIDNSLDQNILIDLETASLEELERESLRLHDASDYYDSLQLGTKEFLNIVYGGTASVYFQCFNLNVAESITLQSQQMTRVASTFINSYFNLVFPKDKRMHELLNVDSELASKFSINYNNNRKDDLGVITLERYSDTDSVYVTFETLIDYFSIPDDKAIEWILKLNREGLEPFIDQCFEMYSKQFNCLSNTQSLELEKISFALQMHAKKRYIMDNAWEEPHIFHKPLDKLMYTGIEVNQSSTSSFARECIVDFVNYAFKKFYARDVNLSDFIEKIKEYRSKFIMEDPERIIKSYKINNYDQYIINDKTEYLFRKGTPFHCKGAAYHNYLLNNNNDFANKFELINSGDKVKCYECKPKNANDVIAEQSGYFSFLTGSYPYEYAPPMDFDAEFEKQILKPINRVLSNLRQTFNMTPEEEQRSKMEVLPNMLKLKSLF